MNTEPTNKPKLWNRNYILMITASAFISLSFYMLNPTFPIYIKGLNGNLGMVGFITGVFMVSSVLIRPFAGNSSDKYNKKIIYIAGLAMIVVAMAGYIIFKSIPMIIVFRLLHGLGWGLATTAAGTLTSDNVPHSRMGEGMGFLGVSLVFGMSIGPALGLELINRFDAFTVFAAAIAFTVIGAFLFIVLYKDIIKAEVSTPETPAARVKGLSAIIEKKSLLPASVVFFVGIVQSSIVSFLALYGAERGIANIGYFFTVEAIAILISRPLIGKIADKNGFWTVVIPAILVMTATMVMLYFSVSPMMFIFAAILYGIGFGTMSSSCQAMCVIYADPERRGMANSTYYLGMDFGMGIGSYLAGAIAGALGYSTMYLLGTIPLIIGLAVYLIGGGIRPKMAVKEPAPE
jgi:MFS family permease